MYDFEHNWIWKTEGNEIWKGAKNAGFFMLCLLTHFIVGISTRILTVNMIKKFCARPFLIGWKSIFCSSSFAIKPTIVPSCIIKRELKRFVDVHLTLETFFNTKIFQKLLQIGLKCVLNRDLNLTWNGPQLNILCVWT